MGGSAAVPAVPAGTVTDEPARPDSSARRWWPVAVLVLIAVGSAVAAAPVFRHGIVASPFPSYIDGEPPYEVLRYSAPWIAGGMALGGLAVLLLVIAVDLTVRRRPRRGPVAVTARSGA
jgi:hypothetical protein